MKKAVLIILAGFTSFYLSAQQAQFGIKGGINVSNTTNNQTGGTDSRIGLHAGLLAHIHLDPDWALQPEFVYSSEGGKYIISDGEHHLILNYINIPLQLQYMFANGFRLQTGPQLGFLVNAKDKIGSVETGNVDSRDFKSIDFAWSFGLGYLSSSGFGVDGRYNLGVSNINNVSIATIHDNTFQIGIFYMFSTYNSSSNSSSSHRTYTRRR